MRRHKRQAHENEKLRVARKTKGRKEAALLPAQKQVSQTAKELAAFG